MAVKALPVGYLEGGVEYLDALRSLGVRPQFFAWAWDLTTSDWLIVMVSSIVDTGGPLEVSRLLFRAYNAGATPATISPFVVRVYSPKHAAAEALRNIPFWPDAPNTFKVEKTGEVFPYESLRTTIGELEVETMYIYVKDFQIARLGDRLREWDRFKTSVMKLAA